MSKASEWRDRMGDEIDDPTVTVDLSLDMGGLTACVTAWPSEGVGVTFLKAGGMSFPGTLNVKDTLKLARWILDVFGEPLASPPVEGAA